MNEKDLDKLLNRIDAVCVVCGRTFTHTSRLVRDTKNFICMECLCADAYVIYKVFARYDIAFYVLLGVN